jgi:hypothetical protein
MLPECRYGHSQHSRSPRQGYAAYASLFLALGHLLPGHAGAGDVCPRVSRPSGGHRAIGALNSALVGDCRSLSYSIRALSIEPRPGPCNMQECFRGRPGGRRCWGVRCGGGVKPRRCRASCGVMGSAVLCPCSAPKASDVLRGRAQGRSCILRHSGATPGVCRAFFLCYIVSPGPQALLPYIHGGSS